MVSISANDTGHRCSLCSLWVSLWGAYLLGDPDAFTSHRRSEGVLSRRVSRVRPRRVSATEVGGVSCSR